MYLYYSLASVGLEKTNYQNKFQEAQVVRMGMADIQTDQEVVQDQVSCLSV